MFIKHITVISIVVLCLPIAATTATIDPIYKYAWSDKIGWIDFAPANSTVTITDTALTGYVWNDNYGWINLAPTESGVVNTTAGDLAGFAWGEYVGWIDFDGAMINTSGKFTGTASGSIIGTLSFDCDQCDVRTDWRPTTISGSTPTLTPAPTPTSQYVPGTTTTPTPFVSPTPISTPAQTCRLFSINLQIGTQGQEVIRLQEFLRAQGLFDYPTNTGYFGQITKTAVMQFQEKYSESILKPLGLLKPTGNWYPATMAKANSMLSCPAR